MSQIIAAITFLGGILTCVLLFTAIAYSSMTAIDVILRALKIHSEFVNFMWMRRKR